MAWELPVDNKQGNEPKNNWSYHEKREFYGVKTHRVDFYQDTFSFSVTWDVMELSRFIFRFLHQTFF